MAETETAASTPPTRLLTRTVSSSSFGSDGEVSVASFQTIQSVSDKVLKAGGSAQSLEKRAHNAAERLSPPPFHGPLLPPPPTLEIRRKELFEALQELHTNTVSWDMSHSAVFLQPVDLAALPGYTKVVSQPIDLSEIGAKIALQRYKSHWSYLRDMHLMFDNAHKFNRPGSWHHRYCTKMCDWWETQAHETFMNNLSHHRLCCATRRNHSAEVYRCRGGPCFIQTGQIYYYLSLADGDNIVYCTSHFSKLEDEFEIPRYGNGTGEKLHLKKSKFTRQKHTEPLVPERFVKCTECHLRYHEVCVRYIPYQRKRYTCRSCKVLAQMSADEAAFTSSDPIDSVEAVDSVDAMAPEPTQVPPQHGFESHDETLPKATDLPLSFLASVIQREVLEEVPHLQDHIIVRTINHSKEHVTPKPNILRRFPTYPRQIPYTRKVILVFLRLDQVDVCIYGVICHECDDEAPQPNSRKVYISLLDSVKMPKHIIPSGERTRIYHSVLRGYFRYAASRGFRTAHIFTCPPRRGQSYIFPFKPDYQREISVTRLRNWYDELLSNSMFRKNPPVLDVMTIADAYPEAMMAEIPYFEGDNWPDILEDIIMFEERDHERRFLARNAKHIVDESFQRAQELRMQLSAKRIKPGRHRGNPPAKRPKAPPAKPEKPVPSLDMRLRAVIARSHRDFLVVTFMPLQDQFIADCDDPASIATTGEDHSVASFLKAERLEFSTLRHAKYSSVCMLYLLAAKSKKFKTRWKDNPPQCLAALLGEDGATDHSHHQQQGTQGGESDAASSTADLDEEDDRELQGHSQHQQDSSSEGEVCEDQGTAQDSPVSFSTVKDADTFAATETAIPRHLKAEALHAPGNPSPLRTTTTSSACDPQTPIL
eukprot:m.101061 g.101061  ORF g.101061 m.101061 type:complete len:877 (+) comp13190_c0_seq6:218-2848(+)